MVRMNDGLAGAVNVHIFSTHMNSDTNLSKFGTEDGLNVAVRRKQVITPHSPAPSHALGLTSPRALGQFEELKQFMEDMVGDDNGIVLLCGDMNINARVGVFRMTRSFHPPLVSNPSAGLDLSFFARHDVCGNTHSVAAVSQRVRRVHGHPDSPRTPRALGSADPE